eukprot:SAG31_NODE_2012_length_6668_cov_5.925407_2_plen_89_part_00
MAGYFGGFYAYSGNGSDIFESFFGTSNPFASIIEGGEHSFFSCQTVSTSHQIAFDCCDATVATAVDTAGAVVVEPGPVHTVRTTTTIH